MCVVQLIQTYGPTHIGWDEILLAIDPIHRINWTIINIKTERDIMTKKEMLDKINEVYMIIDNIMSDEDVEWAEDTLQEVMDALKDEEEQS